MTACTPDLLDLVEDWAVVENLTSSDHNGISFSIKLKKSEGVSVIRTTRLYNTKKARWDEFHEKLK